MNKVSIITGILMGTFMSFIMSAIITAINTGIGGDYLLRWLNAFILAWLCAVPLAVLLGPYSRKTAMRWAGVQPDGQNPERKN